MRRTSEKSTRSRGASAGRTARVCSNELRCEKFVAIEKNGKAANDAESGGDPGENLCAGANGGVHIESDWSEKRDGAAGEGEFESEIAEANTFQRGVHAAAKARGDDGARPSVMHGVGAESRVAGF